MPAAANCQNCEEPLHGPYCARCGQHAHESARTVGALLHDAWHLFTHLDGRLWRTLAALLLRPGRLTLEYFAEHRARYLPPVRLYLVLSVLAFALASFGRSLDVGSGQVEWQRDPAVAADAARLRQEIAAAVARQPTAAAVDAAKLGEEIAAAVARQRSAATAAVPVAAVTDEAAAGGLVFDTKDCVRLQSSWKWLERPLRSACARNLADHGRSLGRALAANIPKMMFIFLPLMAGVMLMLYWWPRRLYVEHLVFFLHTHAAMFLLLLVTITGFWIGSMIPVLATAASFLRVAAVGYSVWYVYRAMRNFYGQGRWLTLTKLTAVGFAYAIFLSLTLLATLVVSALTV